MGMLFILIYPKPYSRYLRMPEMGLINKSWHHPDCQQGSLVPEGPLWRHPSDVPGAPIFHHTRGVLRIRINFANTPMAPKRDSMPAAVRSLCFAAPQNELVGQQFTELLLLLRNSN